MTPARLIARAAPEAWWPVLAKVEPAILWAIYAPGRWLVRWGFGVEALKLAGTAAATVAALACVVPMSRALRA